MRGSAGTRGCRGMLCLLIRSSASSSLSSRNSSLRSLLPLRSFWSWTNERVCQVLIIKCDVWGESGQRGTVPWISCRALI